MKRIKIVHNGPVSSFNSDWLAPIFDQYLEFVPAESGVTPAPGTLYYVNCLNIGNVSLPDLIDQGFKVIIDNLWEVNPGHSGAALTVTCDQWFWYNESLWYQHLGYDQYRPSKNTVYQALMLINRRKSHRDFFLHCVNTDKLLWSYCEAGRQLPNDGNMTNWNTQRNFNPAWYDQSQCSMVVESIVRPGSKLTPIFITEKTMKPMAFYHPMIVYGNRGTLRTLREWGFETFDNLWDESYDHLVDVGERTKAVAEILHQVKIQEYDAETQRRLHHNHNHFFNTQLVTDNIVKQIIEPIINYAETR
jgi:hypothetical protein